MLDVETQRIVLAVCVATTLTILAIDWALFMCHGTPGTISGACKWGFQRWPITYTMVVLWIGVLVGHILPVGQ